MGIKFWADIDETTKRLSLLASDTDDSRSHLPFGKVFRFPVASFEVEANCPLDAKKFAENIASLLNNLKPLHHIPAEAQQIHYRRFPTGFSLTSKAQRGPGQSEEVIGIVFENKGQQAIIGGDVLHRMDNDFMKKVCDGIVCDSAVHVPQHKGSSGPAAKL